MKKNSVRWLKKWHAMVLQECGTDDIAVLSDGVKGLMHLNAGRVYCCWKCKKVKTGEPAYSTLAINGRFEYCPDCWQPTLRTHSLTLTFRPVQKTASDIPPKKKRSL